MCGIAVVYDPEGRAGPTELAAVGEPMLDRLEHRGPDGTSSHHVGSAWLGHTRLSIVDVEGGDQPLTDAQRGRYVVCNGEIYNHEVLRDDIEATFLTRSDSEVALHVSTDGPDGVARLHGMFAFCVADEDGGFLAARDRLGVKPLYWARHDGLVAFASEMQAFDPAWRPHVEAFPPGHAWAPRLGLVRYGEIAEETKEYADRAQAHEAIRSGLINAVRRRMMADVPVGVFLSGGLDSSLVAAVMARDAQREGFEVHSFAARAARRSIGFCL